MAETEAPKPVLTLQDCFAKTAEWFKDRPNFIAIHTVAFDDGHFDGFTVSVHVRGGLKKLRSLFPGREAIVKPVSHNKCSYKVHVDGIEFWVIEEVENNTPATVTL